MRAMTSWCNLAKMQPYDSHLLFSDQTAPVLTLPSAKKMEDCFGNLRHYHHKFSLSSPNKHCEKMSIIRIKYSVSLVFTV